MYTHKIYQVILRLVRRTFHTTAPLACDMMRSTQKHSNLTNVWNLFPNSSRRHAAEIHTNWPSSIFSWIFRLWEANFYFQNQLDFDMAPPFVCIAQKAHTYTHLFLKSIIINVWWWWQQFACVYNNKYIGICVVVNLILAFRRVWAIYWAR